MRKSSELFVDAILTIGVSMILLPPCIWFTLKYVIYDSMTFSYLFQISTVFMFMQIAQNHVVMFALPEKWSGRVNKLLEVTAIVFLLQGAFVKQTSKWFVYGTSIMPLDFFAWFLRFGLRAYNRDIVLEPGQEVFRYIKLDVIMNIGLFCIAIQVLIIAYCWPV